MSSSSASSGSSGLTLERKNEGDDRDRERTEEGSVENIGKRKREEAEDSGRSKERRQDETPSSNSSKNREEGKMMKATERGWTGRCPWPPPNHSTARGKHCAGRGPTAVRPAPEELVELERVAVEDELFGPLGDLVVDLNARGCTA